MAEGNKGKEMHLQVTEDKSEGVRQAASESAPSQTIHSPGRVLQPVLYPFPNTFEQHNPMPASTQEEVPPCSMRLTPKKVCMGLQLE